MSRVLVTGAGGFIGIPVLQALAETGAEIHAVSRTGVPPVDTGSPESVTWHAADLGDESAPQSLLADLEPERLVHLAWYVEHGRFWRAPENVAWVEWSLRLLRAFAAAGGRRAVMLGTCAEYDWSTADGPLSEFTSPLGPSTLYGTAKDALRRVAEAYARELGIGFAWGRLFFLYGPRESPSRLVPAVIRPLLTGEPVDTTTGEQRRDFMHVEDVAGAVAALLDSDVSGPVNIGSGDAVAVSELVARLAASIGRAELVRAGSLPSRNEPPLLVADVGRLREEVGFRPRFTLQDGLDATVRWWAERLPPIHSRGA